MKIKLKKSKKGNYTAWVSGTYFRGTLFTGLSDEIAAKEAVIRTIKTFERNSNVDLETIQFVNPLRSGANAHRRYARPHA